MSMNAAMVRKTLMGYPLKGIQAVAASEGLAWTDKANICDQLTAMVMSGRCYLPALASAAGVTAGAMHPHKPQGVAAVTQQPASTVVTDALKGEIDRLKDAAALNNDRLRGVEDGVKALQVTAKTVGHVIEHDLADGLKGVSNALAALEKKADAQAAALRSQVSAIRIDDAAVAVQVTEAVAAAFKPFAAAVADAGAEAVIGSMVGATVMRRDTCSNVFGVEVRDMRGNEVMVDLWDHASAPAVDPNFLWSADILRHLLLSQDTGENLWFGGEKGTGKSETARQFAARTGRAFTRINFTKHTGVEDFIGATGLVNGQTVFEPKGFLMAYTCPSSVILLDEVTNADPAELAVLNGLLESNAAVTIGGSVWRRAPGVLCFAADNTLTNGDQSGRYAGTRAMNSALADRFARIVHFAFLPIDQEVDAVVRHTGCNEALARHVVEAVNICRAKVETGDIIDAPSIRSVCAFIRAVQRMPVAEAWYTAIAARQPAESAAGLAAVYAATINEQLIIDHL